QNRLTAIRFFFFYFQTGRWNDSCFPLHLGWMHFNDKCFLFKGKKNDIKANWTYARSWCKDQGGELAVIDNQSENDMELPTWIGLSDILVENQYAWSDGVSPVLYTNWNGKEPNNAGGTENCVEMYPDGRWNDNDCLQKRGFVCRHRQCKHSDGSRVASASWQPLKTGLCCLFVIRLHHRRWRKPRFPHRWAKC
uniref:C-type lectin domain-containing protein n=1 Tax=Hippocampus comes TaxID=109280 RepID=A0A3Q2YER2_HIPCM